MARRQFPQHNLPRTQWGRISGAADVWHNDTAGVIIGEDYFEASSSGEIAAQPIVTGAPTVTAAGITQAHVLAAQAVTTAAPTVGGTIVQRHVLAAQAIATGAPTVTAGGIAQVHVLAAAPIETGAPVVEATALDGTAPPVVLNFTSTGGPRMVGWPPRPEPEVLAELADKAERERREREDASRRVIAKAEASLAAAKSQVAAASGGMLRLAAIADVQAKLDGALARVAAVQRAEDQLSAELERRSQAIAQMIAAFVAEMAAEADDEEVLLLAA